MDEFEGMAVYDPGEDDITTTKMLFSLEYPAYDIIESSIKYLTYISGASSKFHAFWLATDKDGNYYAFNAYARIGYSPRIHRIIGPTSQETAMSALRRKLRKKENKGYTNRTSDFLSAEGMEMTPDIEGYPGLPVVPDSYGTNSALDSGQGVPVWYGSAETFNAEYKAGNASQLVDLADGLGGTIEITSLKDFERNYLTNYNRHYVSGDEVDFMFLDGSMATCIQDPRNVLSTFVEGYSADAEDEDMDYDRYSFKHTDLEVTHPLKTGFLLGLGWILAPVVAGLTAAGIIGLLWKGEK